MRRYTEEDKQRIATLFQTDFSYCKPLGFKKREVKRALEVVWNDDNFWFHCADRQGLFENSIDKISRVNLAHAAGNFWAMLREVIHRTDTSNVWLH